MKTKRKTLVTLFAFAMSIILLIACLCMGLSFVHASAATKQNKVLFIVDDDVSFSTLTEDMSENGMDESLYALMHLSDAAESNLSTYAAVALPANEAGTQKASYIDIQETRVYLYGNVTISAYKAATGLGEFSVEIPLHDPSGNRTSTAVQFFDEAYEQTEIFHAICSGEHALLGTISGEEPTLYTYFALILDNCKPFLLPQTRATIIESGFDYTTTMFGENYVRGVVHLDYSLYRNYDEEDPNYDYFGIKTRTWVTCENGNVSTIRTEYRLPTLEDELIESAPSSYLKASVLNFSIGFGTSGPSAELGLSIDLSDTKPNIDRTENLSTDTVKWIMSRSAFSKWLNGTRMDCAATWAHKATPENVAAFFIDFSGQIKHGWINEYTEESNIGHAYLTIYY